MNVERRIATFNRINDGFATFAYMRYIDDTGGKPRKRHKGPQKGRHSNTYLFVWPKREAKKNIFKFHTKIMKKKSISAFQCNKFNKYVFLNGNGSGILR